MDNNMREKFENWMLDEGLALPHWFVECWDEQLGSYRSDDDKLQKYWVGYNAGVAHERKRTEKLVEALWLARETAEFSQSETIHILNKALREYGEGL